MKFPYLTAAALIAMTPAIALAAPTVEVVTADNIVWIPGDEVA